MNLFIRTRKLVTANLNDWMDRLERPEQLARQSLRELEQGVLAATLATARSIVAERLLERQHRQYAEEAIAWKQRAAESVRAGGMSRSRGNRWLRRFASQLAERAAERLTATTEVNRKLRDQLDRLRERYRQARDQLTVDAARLNAASAIRELNTTLGASTAMPALDDVERELERVERATLEAEVQVELTGDPAAELAADFQRRDEEQFVRDELDRLRGAS